MRFRVSNESNTDVYLCIGQKKYLILANDRDTVIDDVQEADFISVKRVNTLPLPNKKRIFWRTFLGGWASLFIKQSPYLLDVSAGYRLPYMKSESVRLKIFRTVAQSYEEGIYDAICISSSDLDLTDAVYHVENKNEISRMYQSCRHSANLWFYALMEILFTLVGSAIFCPIVFAFYITTQALLFKILTVAIPFFLFALIALIGVLPMHCLFKYREKEFYRSMEHEEIVSCFKK